MPRHIFQTAAILLVALMSFAACATSSAVAGGEALNVQIQVDNNLRGLAGVSVYLATDAGARRSLGPLASNAKGTYDRVLRAGDYQLIATQLGEPDIVSERFRVDTDNVVVIWAVAQNQLTFGQRD